MATRSRGVTLVEILVATSIAGILMTAALPAAHELVFASRLDTSTRQLHNHIQLTRTAAVQFRRFATLCPRGGRIDATGQRCGNDWNQGYVVFVDRDGDGTRDVPDDALLAEAPARAGVHTTWRSFRRRDALMFRADGATHLSNGTFTLCPAGVGNAADEHAGGGADAGVVRLVINIGGRTRTDRRGDPAALCD